MYFKTKKKHIHSKNIISSMKLYKHIFIAHPCTIQPSSIHVAYVKLLSVYKENYTYKCTCYTHALQNG